jgi:putative SOS response-associated peptidase YedK
MCYSAMVTQNVKSLGLRYQARVQVDLFDDLFQKRLVGANVKITPAMEAAFLEAPKTPIEQRIQKNILLWREREHEKAIADLEIQEKRLDLAEKSLLSKVTKKAQTDQRVATAKIAVLTTKIKKLKQGDSHENELDSRIYPGNYAPLIIEKDGERVIQPFRYLLRPAGQEADFDRKFNGAYNARRDRLKKVAWWRSLFGKNHGVLELKAFYENVKRHDFENRPLREQEAEENLIVRFTPRSTEEILVPCIWDRNDADTHPLFSFALITDEPNPEVSAVGHDRTPLVLKRENLGTWLTPSSDLSVFERIFNDKPATHFLNNDNFQEKENG